MVIWSLPARNDLRSIYDYIACDSKFYAKKIIDELIDLSESLTHFAERGRVVPEFGDENVRELFAYSFRLIYEMRGQDIFILAVIHSKRDISSAKIEDLKKDK
jgi:plasmid stabilization system protein ParE